MQRVVVFSQNDGAVVQRFSCSPHLDFPVGVAANAERDEIYISDNRGHAVKVSNYLKCFLLLSCADCGLYKGVLAVQLLS